MKRRFCCLMLTVSMLLCSACGYKHSAPMPEQAPTAETRDETGQEADLARFAPVLDAVCDVIRNGCRMGYEYPSVPYGVIETVFWNDGGNVAEELGFAFMDLNGDGMSELLIGAAEDALLGGFSLVNGESVSFMEGWSRNWYQLLGDGRIFNRGSGGAMSSAFGAYRLSGDGTELVCEDFYFTDADEEDEERIALYHNTTGAWDAAVSERLDISDEEFWARYEAYAEDFVQPRLTLFSDYAYSGLFNQPIDCKVRADYLDDVSWKLSESEDIGAYFPELRSGGGDYEVEVVFLSAAGVEDFKLLALEPRDVDESGNAGFAVTELCCLPELKAGIPLVVPMTFPGDMPTNGFSYREYGAEKRFSISQSGRDGALVVAAINDD